VDTSSDPANCGSCGSPCAGGEACVLGVCRETSCAAPRYSQVFTGSAIASAQCVAWNAWIPTIDATGCSGLTMKGSFDTTGVSCTDPTVVQAIATALRTAASGSWTCDGRSWRTGPCGRGTELSAEGSICACPSPGYIMRPCIETTVNWGGVNTATCSAPTQTMTLEFW
jgi:hypothetical protein